MNQPKPKVTVHYPPAAQARPGQITLEQLKELYAKSQRRPKPPKPAEEPPKPAEGTAEDASTS